MVSRCQVFYICSLLFGEDSYFDVFLLFIPNGLKPPPRIMSHLPEGTPVASPQNSVVDRTLWCVWFWVPSSKKFNLTPPCDHIFASTCYCVLCRGWCYLSMMWLDSSKPFSLLWPAPRVIFQWAYCPRRSSRKCDCHGARFAVAYTRATALIGRVAVYAARLGGVSAL